MKSHPRLFKRELEKALLEYQKENGDILGRFKDQKCKKRIRVFLNLSLSKEQYEIVQPDILFNNEFKAIYRELFSITYYRVKSKIKEEEKT